jgi:signal transduction histidine kinase
MSSGVLRQVYPRDAEIPRPAGVLARMVGWILRVPLILKLLGANLLIDVLVVVEPIVFPGGFALTHPVTVLLLSTTTSLLLVWLALRPIAILEAAAERVSGGDFDARVPYSALADRKVTQLSVTLNRLLDRVQADRARIQYLAGRSVRARDIERESVARELRDSLAQLVSGIALQVAAVRQGSTDPETGKQLETVSASVEALTDQLRGVAEALYPGTISEFGLPNALRALGRVFARRSGIAIEVVADGQDPHLSPAASGALYRVAEEALRNVVQHSRASNALVRLRCDAEGVTLEVTDDGVGVNMEAGDLVRAGLGLFSAQSVLALAGGELHVSSATARGTRVLAHIPPSAFVQG